MASKPPPKKKNSKSEGAVFLNPLLKRGASAAAASGTADGKLEEQVHVQLGVKVGGMPPAPAILTSFFERIAPRIRLGETACEVLESPEKIVEALRKDEYSEAQFFRWFRSFGQREKADELDSAVILLGTRNSRNFIVALHALRAVQGRVTEWGTEGNPFFQPEEILRYAVKSEEPLIAAKAPHSEMAFAAGVVFDLLALIAARMGSKGKRILSFIDKVYSNGLRSALIARELVMEMRGLELNQYLFSACLLHDVGKIVLAMLDSDCLEFFDRCDKEPSLSNALRLFAEEKGFEMNHAQFSGICCDTFPFFQKFSKVVSLHHEPYSLKGAGNGLEQLGLLVCLSGNMADHFELSGKEDDPIVWKWKTMEVRDSKLDAAALMRVASRLHKKI